MDATTFLTLTETCAPLIDAGTAHVLVTVESGLNPNAIGVVGGVLERQPRTRAEALATAHSLQAAGWNFSVGLAQINLYTLDRLGLPLQSAFDPCANLGAMQTVLRSCMDRTSRGADHSQFALRQALSCYYSGNFTTGFDHGYVQRVVGAARATARRNPSMPPTPTQESR